MEENLQTPTTTSATSTTTTTTQESNMFLDDIDSGCSTPYVSAPSSPGRNQPCSGYYYSAPTSPMHFILSKTSFISPDNKKTSSSTPTLSPPSSSFEFDISSKLATNNSTSPEKSMSSADELFLNGQIRPMKLSTHLQRPQILTPLLDVDDENDDENFIEQDHVRGRESAKLRNKSLRRRTRSMSPLRHSSSNSSFVWEKEEDDEMLPTTETKQNPDINEEVTERNTDSSENTSRSSSVGRNSKRWVFLKEFLYRSKSEGRNNGQKFWGGLSFSPVKDKKIEIIPRKMKIFNGEKQEKVKENGVKDEKMKRVKAINGGILMGKKRIPQSAHELHYTTNRAQAEEMRKKTFLPYRQGLLGCLGFNSKSYGAWNGFTRALNHVSSR